MDEVVIDKRRIDALESECEILDVASDPTFAVFTVLKSDEVEDDAHAATGRAVSITTLPGPRGGSRVVDSSVQVQESVRCAMLTRSIDHPSRRRWRRSRS